MIPFQEKHGPLFFHVFCKKKALHIIERKKFEKFTFYENVRETNQLFSEKWIIQQETTRIMLSLRDSPERGVEEDQFSFAGCGKFNVFYGDECRSKN